jgi:hypothetical protein
MSNDDERDGIDCVDGLTCRVCKRAYASKRSLRRHMETKFHQRNLLMECKYKCGPCGFGTDDRYKYVRHCETRRHLANANRAPVEPEGGTFECAPCGKVYKFRSGLSRHRMRCPHAGEGASSEAIVGGGNVGGDKGAAGTAVGTGDVPAGPMSADQVGFIVRSLKEYLDKHPRVVHTGNTTITSNNVYIENFLNTQCSDAPNISDVVRHIHLQVTDLIHMSQNGFASSASKVLIEHIGEMDVNKRPIHCTNRRTRVMYIKENDCWEKDKDHRVMGSVVRKIYRKHVDGVIQYEDDAPPGFFQDEQRSREKNNMMIELAKYVESENDATKAVMKGISEAVYTNSRLLGQSAQDRLPAASCVSLITRPQEGGR